MIYQTGLKKAFLRELTLGLTLLNTIWFVTTLANVGHHRAYIALDTLTISCLAVAGLRFGLLVSLTIKFSL